MYQKTQTNDLIIPAERLKYIPKEVITIIQNKRIKKRETFLNKLIEELRK